MSGSEWGTNEGEIEYGDWDYEMEQESAEEARMRMSEEEIEADLAFDPFAAQG